MAFEAIEGGQVKKETGQQAPEDAFDIVGNQSIVTGIVRIKPEQNNQTGNGHDHDQTGQGGKALADLNANQNNDQTHG
jgi:hypothetical protein